MTSASFPARQVVAAANIANQHTDASHADAARLRALLLMARHVVAQAENTRMQLDLADFALIAAWYPEPVMSSQDE